MTKSSGLSGQPQFIKFHLNLLYAIYEGHWDGWFTTRDVWELILKYEENRGFIPRAVNRGIFITENSYKSNTPYNYKITPNIRDMILSFKEALK